jgi:hypothetical protein
VTLKGSSRRAGGCLQATVAPQVPLLMLLLCVCCWFCACVCCSLPNALKATKPEDDLCNSMGFVCNMKGQLEKIDFSNAGRWAGSADTGCWQERSESDSSSYGSTSMHKTCALIAGKGRGAFIGLRVQWARSQIWPEQAPMHPATACSADLHTCCCVPAAVLQASSARSSLQSLGTSLPWRHSCCASTTSTRTPLKTWLK